MRNSTTVVVRGLSIGMVLMAGAFARVQPVWGLEPEREDAALDALMDESAMGDLVMGVSPELLMFQEIPTVTLATKHAQPLNLAPASISVITAEDIRRQGARTITDVLRNVPGINVNRITNSDVNIAARFPADAANAEMLVLIDGRTVYLDFFGIVLWDALPVVMEDIERIEIIRGPSSPLYGANAYAGIVNIVTKDPADHASNTISGTVGNPDRFVGTYIHAGSREQWRYKVVVSWNEIGEFTDPNEQARENLKAYSTHIYEFDADTEFRLNLGVEDSDSDTFTGLGRFAGDRQQFHVQGVLKHGNWEGQLFYNRFDGHVSNPLLDPFPNGLILDGFPPAPVLDPVSPQGRSDIVNNVFNAELQHSFATFDAHNVTWGGGYRYNGIRSRNIFGKSEHLDIFNAFVQDVWSVTDNLTVTASVRVDHRQLTGVTVSPRIAAVYQWQDNHVFRASFGQAFRDPTQVESYINITGGLLTSLSAIPVKLRANGNRDLDPMEITSFELGYNGQYLDDTLRVKLDVFYNELDEIIEFLQPNPLIPTFTFVNAGSAHQYGGEIEVEYFWKTWLRPYVNYSFLYFRAEDDDILSGFQQRNRKIRSAPQHKINAGVFAEWESGLSAMVQVHWVDDIVEDFLNPGLPPPTSLSEKVDSYARVDARFAYHVKDPDVEVSMVVFNLLNDRHREHPVGLPMERAVLLNALWRF